MRHLLISAAEDVTADLLCERLAADVLRVNLERWAEYDLTVTHTGFRIADRHGREVTDATLGNIIWRKPLATVDPQLGEGWYAFHEFKYSVDAVVGWARERNPRKLPVDPHRSALVDKFRQLRLAARRFPVPDWICTCTPSRLAWGPEPRVVKSMTSKPIPGTGDFARVIYTTEVEVARLADGFPWFIQKRVDAPCDLTVVYVDGALFGFALDRSLFPGLDWRKAIGEPSVDAGWKRVHLPDALTEGVQALMHDLDLRFGRIDFLADANCGNVCFLEVNPNGQWAWLDLDQDNGLFDAVVRFLTSE